MAGGVGTRFWPLSRTSMPKQFLDILGNGRSLIQQTFDRFNEICPPENVYVVTSREYKDMVLSHLPELSESQVLLEPRRRNTAPCIQYAMQRIAKINPKANIIVTPSDHLIEKEEEFVRLLKTGLEFTLKNNALLTLGLKPSRPETGYGYIQLLPNSYDHPEIDKVKTFTEKPNIEMARIFYESGDFFWNSGIFIWSLESIQDSFIRNLPDVYELFEEGKEIYGSNAEDEFIDETYEKCRTISIDYGVMEKADNVYVLCADIGWSDLGTWGSLYDHTTKDENGNGIIGDNAITMKSKNCLVNVSSGKKVVVHGLDNFIIVEDNNSILIINKEDEQEIREVVERVSKNFGEEFI